MKRYLKYIFIALASAILAVSCLEELEPTPSLTANDEVAVLVPRVKSFTNQYVTKSDYNEAEITLTSLKVLVFNKGGKLIHHQDVPVESRTISLNKSMLNSPDNGDLSSATVVMLANMDLARLKNGSTPLSNNLTNLQLTDLENYSYSHEQTVYTSLESGFKGFPMIGGTTGVDLSPTSSTNQQDPVVVDLKILYAKVNFRISVDQDGENQRVNPSDTKQMQFQLDKYAVYNASKVTTLAIPNNEGEPVCDFLGNIPDESNIPGTDEATLSSDYAYTSGAGANLNINKTVTLGGEPILFTFYIAESRYNHNLTLEELRGIYPDSGWVTSAQNDDVKGWENLSAEEKKLPQNKLNNVKYLYDDLIQQYKPKLADVAGASPDKGKASYVLLTGKYTDYRGTVWDVDYKVYLGKDNSQNFHVDRNSEYTNYISIKGIRNNDDYYDKDENGNKVDQHIWIDHRVNVSYNGSGVDDHVTITRETLLDAHIEVRPLRVKWDNDDNYDGVRIYLPTKDSYGSLVDWIGIERFTGNNNTDKNVYCYAGGKSTGKRRYFTTDLITELQTKQGEYGVREDEKTKQKYIYLLINDCAWIYFDENLGNTDREADIKLEFYPKEGSPQSMVYKVKQRCLQTVGGYAIESYEEYLHSYDSADKYNLSTSPVDYTQQGLEWGFPEHRLSQNILVSNTEIPLNLTKDERIKRYVYDYFHESDGATYKLYTKASGSWATTSFGTGHTFTERASANRDIAVKDMGTLPENAYQYCLSKNKFEVVGLEEVTMTLNWYLPDPYEMQTILDASQKDNNTADIDADAFYWSSQPAFNRESYLGSTFINENISNAIAVSAQQPADDFSRRSQNRIRCVYNRNAKPLTPEEMEDRVPDGIGGNFTFYMSAYSDKNKSEIGFFNYLLPNQETFPTSTEVKLNDSYGYKTETDSYDFPTSENSNSESFFPYTSFQKDDNSWVSGFSVDPSNKSNWDETVANYYNTLTTYPGLSKYVLQKGITEARAETTTEKQKVKTVQDISTIVLDKRISSTTSLNTLDHVQGSSIFNISFAQSNGNQDPFFTYNETVSENKTETTYKWAPPVYTYDTHNLKPEEDEITGSGSYKTINLNTTKNKDDARKNAFQRAYDQAKTNALRDLNNNLAAKNQTDPGWVISGNVDYTPLEWNTIPETSYSNETRTPVIFGIGGYWSSTCEVSVTATAKIVRSGSIKLFNHTSDGEWIQTKENISSSNGVITTDEFRMYCGNSFTISLSQDAKEQGYEITKVKLYFTGSNLMDSNELPYVYNNYVYARFVESSIPLPPAKQILALGAQESLQLPGMDYDDKGQWQQWTGTAEEGSLTFILADYRHTDFLSVSHEYEYDLSPDTPNKYIVVSQIDVKCSKRKNATFDFAKIYAENGETSDWSVKHITFTAEGGTEDNPSGVTAEGLKLYAGSKVTFKALDGYVINSISGDESLKFTGTEQVVERTIPTDKTITAPIVVLYSKADPGTN